MEAMKHAYPDCRLVATFFSPSGYEVLKNDPLCDGIFYLPFESRRAAKFVIKCFNPKMAILIKYDFWYYYLKALHQNQIPVYLCAAQFRKGQRYFKSYASFHQKFISQFDYYFCQNQESKELLKSIGIENSIVTGDNRYDRVYQLLQNSEKLPLIDKFKGDSFLLIAGSSYEVEEELLSYAIENVKHEFKVIIAPHFVDTKRITTIEKKFGESAILYSQLYDHTDNIDKKIVIIDSIGLLAKIYRYGNAALIGGGFWEKGLHNSLEAATFGMPISFGPKIKRFPEAKELVKEGIAEIVMDKISFSNWLNQLLAEPNRCKEVSEKSRKFVSKNVGATQMVLDKIKELNPI